MKKRILFLSAYHADSHRYWCESLMDELDEYEWVLLSLPARFFSWRIRGNPLSFIAEHANQLKQHFDVCFCTSMVDLATLKSLVPTLQGVPCIAYFHENQFAYPVNTSQHASLEPQMVNLYTALAADTVLFNSAFNRNSFVQGVDALMAKMPDKAPTALGAQLMDKSQILPVPLYAQKVMISSVVTEESKVPLITWNHRWEYDKGPELLLEILRQLDNRSCVFDLAIIGQQFRRQPDAFQHIHALVQKSDCLTLKHWGYIESEDDYHQCLASTDIVLSSALHDFQGLSVLQAVLAGAMPVLPDRQVYPEWFDQQYLYDISGDLTQQATSAVSVIQGLCSQPLSPDIRQLLWPALKEQYRQVIETVRS